jgi:Zn finger protein HypA/HybF involved in hydrogenase expression
MRHCKHCGLNSSETEFYALTYGSCKTCHNRITLKNYWKNRDSRIARQVIYNKAKKWNNANPEKVKAQGLVRQYVHTGRIKKPSKCEKCGKDARLDGHHSDYAKKLEVMWLCRKCHSGIRHS